MRLLGIEVDPTALLGGCAFAIAAVACVAAAVLDNARRGSAPSAAWWGFAVVQFGCLAEIVVGLRHRLHGIVDTVLQAHQTYGSRAPWQIAFLVLTSFLAIGSVAVVGRRLRHDAAALGALFGTALGVLLFVFETISLHAIDRWMYAPAGPVLTVALMWALAATLVTVSALAAAWRALRPPR